MLIENTKCNFLKLASVISTKLYDIEGNFSKNKNKNKASPTYLGFIKKTQAHA